MALSSHKRFGVTFDHFHNDSTTVSFCGQYKAARGRSIRGKSAPFITFGHSKAHRPDLKQLLYVLTCSGDGHVPVGFRCEAGIFWLEENVERMLHLRAYFKAGRWDELMSRVFHATAHGKPMRELADAA